MKSEKVMFAALTLALGIAAGSPEVARADGVYLAVGIGTAVQPMNEDSRNPIGIIRVGYEWRDFHAEYEHQSSIQDGPPFNDQTDHRWQERAIIFYVWRF